MFKIGDRWAGGFFWGLEYSDVDVKHIFRNAIREGRNIFEVFSVKEEGEHQVASKSRWDDCQRRRKPQEDKAWKESQGLQTLRRKTTESGFVAF